MSSCSESIEVLSAVSSSAERPLDQFQAFGAPPKLNVLHKVLKSNAGSTSSSANPQDSPTSISDDAIEETSSPPDSDEYPLGLGAGNTSTLQAPMPFPTSESQEAIRPLDHQSSPLPPVSLTSSTASNNMSSVHSWLMLPSDSGNYQPEPSPTPSNFQPDLVPISGEFMQRGQVTSGEAESSAYSELSGGESTVVTSSDQFSQILPSTFDPTTSTLNQGWENSLDDIISNSAVEPQIPDITRSSRERPDIFHEAQSSAADRPTQPVDLLVVQELDVIRAVDESAVLEEGNLNEPVSTFPENTSTAVGNAVDLVVQELDIVRGNDDQSSPSVLPLDVVPQNVEETVAANDPPIVNREPAEPAHISVGA